MVNFRVLLFDIVFVLLKKFWVRNERVFGKNFYFDMEINNVEIKVMRVRYFYGFNVKF